MARQQINLTPEQKLLIHDEVAKAYQEKIQYIQLLLQTAGLAAVVFTVLFGSFTFWFSKEYLSGTIESSIKSDPIFRTEIAGLAVPRGTVVGMLWSSEPGFTVSCPNGWTYFKEAEGRFIVGANWRKFETSGDGKDVTVTRKDPEINKQNIQPHIFDGDPESKTPDLEYSGDAPKRVMFELGQLSLTHPDSISYFALRFCKKD